MSKIESAVDDFISRNHILSGFRDDIISLVRELAAPPSPRPSAYADQAATIYSHYPRKEARGAALKAIEKAIKTDGYAVVMEATEAYAKAVSMWPDGDRRFIPHPATWFNQQRYLDDRTAWVRKAPAPVGRFTAPPQTFAKL